MISPSILARIGNWQVAFRELGSTKGVLAGSRATMGARSRDEAEESVLVAASQHINELVTKLHSKEESQHINELVTKLHSKEESSSRWSSPKCNKKLED